MAIGCFLGVKAFTELGADELIIGLRRSLGSAQRKDTAAKKNDKIQIKGGAVEGSTLDAAGVEALSKSPSREELISMIAGQILAPGANLAAALLGPGSTIASQLKTIHDKDGEGAAESA